MATKYEILERRFYAAQDEANRLRTELDGLDRTPFGHDCGACGTPLATEGDFAKHFVVRDSQYLNLGECPNPKES